MKNNSVGSFTKEKMNTSPKKPQRMTSGARNLCLLGLGATAITFVFTFITLKIYHDSGDIYLDRSRPGFLPEKEEVEQDRDETDYTFSESGSRRISRKPQKRTKSPERLFFRSLRSYSSN